jgi:hypothetical protein
MSLWVRFILWWNNVCPKHGPMTGGNDNLCYLCYDLRWQAKHRRREDAQAQRKIWQNTLWEKYHD